MLEDILHGKEPSQLVIISDSIRHFGRTLLKSFTKSLAARVDEVHIFHFDTAPEVFLSGFDDTTKRKLHSHDGWSDSLMWTRNTKPSNANGKLYFTESLDLVTQISNAKQENSVKIAVIIDSLTPVLIHKYLSFVSKALHHLCNDTGDFTVTQLVCLLHNDVHEEHTVDMIRHSATSCLTLSPNASIASLYDEPYGMCNLVHKKLSGKVITKYEGYSVVDDLRFISFDLSKLPTTAMEESPTETINPTENLTFNLNLSAKERQAKNNIVLPYTIQDAQKASHLRGGAGQIFYQPDEADDYDDEDPDDDLDI
ncbi:elongator complex protein 5-like [Saccoglossus kowalevskii]